MRGEMKFFKRLQVYKAKNVEFNPNKIVATSYSWWHFVELINGKVVYNAYRYSPTTGNHQRKVRALLSTLNIKIDLIVETRLSLDDENALTDAIKNNAKEIEEIKLTLTNNRRKKLLDKDRKKQIRNLMKKNKDIIKVMNSHLSKLERHLK